MYNTANSHRNELSHPCKKKLNMAPAKPSVTLVKPNTVLVAKPKSKFKEMTLNYQNQTRMLERRFANSKHEPIGNASIEEFDRFYLDVYFPVQHKRAPLHMFVNFAQLFTNRFFNKSMKIGKVLDCIAEQGKVVNNNATELDASKQLNLFNLDTGERLLNNKKLLDMPALNRHAVMLEFGEVMSEQVYETIAKAFENPNDTSLCTIC